MARKGVTAITGAPATSTHSEAVVLVDERAGEAQREAVATLVGGTVGGPWGVLGRTWPTVHGPFPVQYEIEDGLGSRVKAGNGYAAIGPFDYAGP